MSANRFHFEPLGRHHDRAAFSCGVESLDYYLQRQASQDSRRGFAAIYVMYDTDAESVAGYYTLSAAGLPPERLPSVLTRKMPQYPEVPSILLSRLAVDRRYQGQGLGGSPLSDALSQALDLSRRLGSVLVLVDAIDDAARSFYQRFGFESVADNPYRLFLPIASIGDLIESSS